jgi:hypothetical protein
MPENQEINQISIKLAVQKERIASLEKQFQLQDQLINQRIINLEQDISNKILVLDQRIIQIQYQLQYIV